MNENFEKYSKVSTEGVEIEGIDSLLRQHFVEHYKSKKVSWIDSFMFMILLTA